MNKKINVAVLDDYQNVCETFGDWSALENDINITVFNKHIGDSGELINLLYPFEVISVMRERTPFTEQLLNSLPNLRLIISTGMRNASIDHTAAAKLDIKICNTGYL